MGIGSSGRLFVGVNVELPGLPLGNSVHAEQFLITNAWQHGEREIEMMAVSAAPCGHCRQVTSGFLGPGMGTRSRRRHLWPGPALCRRQFMCELCCANTMALVFGPESQPQYLKDLLPHQFGPLDLLADEAIVQVARESDGDLSSPSHQLQQQSLREPLLLQPRDNGVAAAAPAPPAASDRAVEAAVAAANRAHVPYTRCPVGAAVVTRLGGVYAGGCIESAAYNPTMPPLQSALIAAIAAGGLPSLADIQQVVLAEMAGAR